MQIAGHEKETYLFINGISVKRTVRLGSKVELLPARCAPDPDAIIKLAQSEVDIGVCAIFLRQIGSQIRVTAKEPKALATLAWNTLWDIVLLGAQFNCEAVCNFQCDTPAENFHAGCRFDITNYHLRGLSNFPFRVISETEARWLENNFEQARKMLDLIPFRNAVHCLYSYKWHSMPNVRIAVLWSGIESLFGIESEIVFRLSLYAARFLSPNRKTKRVQIFNDVKRLYKQRSAAVHGSKIKVDPKQVVDESASLLLSLIKRCIIDGSLPIVDTLAP